MISSSILKGILRTKTFTVFYGTFSEQILHGYTGIEVRFRKLSVCFGQILELIQALIQLTSGVLLRMSSHWFMKFITNLLLVSRLRSMEPYLHFPFAFIKYKENLTFTFPYLAVYGISVTKSNRIIPFREMTSVRCEDNRIWIITLGVKMWIFLMFGFVAQNKYPLTPLEKQAPVSTPQPFTCNCYNLFYFIGC